MEIRLDHVYKAYRGGTMALRDVSATIGSGITGLIGPNGAGKTTLLNLLVGLIRPTQGNVYLDNVSLPKAKRHLYRELGYLPQGCTPYPALTVLEFLDYMAILKGVDDGAQRQDAVARALEQTHLQSWRKRQVKTLSGGTRQRLGIAQALLNDPKVLVLDEPTSGLDPEERLHLRSLLATLAFGRTILVSSHVIGELSAMCEHLLILQDGGLRYQGSPEALCERARGCVWEAELPADAVDTVARRVTVINTRKNGKGVVARILAREPLSECWLPVEPILEDAYICLQTGVQR